MDHVFAAARNTLRVLTAREHRPWSRVVKRCLVHLWIRPLLTGRIHGCSVHTIRVHGPWMWTHRRPIDR